MVSLRGLFPAAASPSCKLFCRSLDCVEPLYRLIPPSDVGIASSPRDSSLSFLWLQFFSHCQYLGFNLCPKTPAPSEAQHQPKLTGFCNPRMAAFSGSGFLALGAANHWLLGMLTSLGDPSTGVLSLKGEQLSGNQDLSVAPQDQHSCWHHGHVRDGYDNCPHI